MIPEIPLFLLKKESSIEKKHLQTKLKEFECHFLTKTNHANKVHRNVWMEWDGLVYNPFAEVLQKG